jgi:tripartite-type tricarboxylate transporter receptor subunit TctC
MFAFDSASLCSCLADAFPTRPVRVIVPFGSAGATDIVARLIGQWLSERLGQPFVIENRPGAGGNLGTEAVVRAPPDGYTLAVIGAPSAINATLYEKLNFNFIRDITPVASIIRFPNVMVVNPSVPATTVPEFIAYAKANPGKLNMASPGNGSTPHVTGELFKMMTGINMVHVPYRSVAAGITDMLSGQVQVTFGTTASTIAYIRAGTLRANPRVYRQLLDQRPFRVDGWIGPRFCIALPARAHRLTLARHVGETQREQPLHRVHLVGDRREELVGAPR